MAEFESKYKIASHCPSCGWENPNKVYWCKKCQTRMIILRDKETPPTVNDSGKCPFCKGEIESGVLKCKHCGEWLDPEKQKKQEEVRKAQVQTGNTAKFIGLLIAIPLVLGAILQMCNAFSH